MLDLDNETLIKLRGERYKSYLEQFVPPINFALQYAGNFRQNVSSFLANDFHPKAGMKFLIESFYRSITQKAPRSRSHTGRSPDFADHGLRYFVDWILNAINPTR